MLRIQTNYTILLLLKLDNTSSYCCPRGSTKLCNKLTHITFVFENAHGLLTIFASIDDNVAISNSFVAHYMVVVLQPLGHSKSGTAPNLMKVYHVQFSAVFAPLLLLQLPITNELI